MDMDIFRLACATCSYRRGRVPPRVVEEEKEGEKIPLAWL